MLIPMNGSMQGLPPKNRRRLINTAWLMICLEHVPAFGVRMGGAVASRAVGSVSPCNALLLAHRRLADVEADLHAAVLVGKRFIESRSKAGTFAVCTWSA